MTILLLPERKHLTSPLINRWIARGDRLPDEPAGDDTLLRSVFDFDGPLAVAALTRQLDGGDAGDASWLRADPAWLRADMMTARMFAHGDLGVSPSEVAALAPALTELFADHGFAFDAPTPTRWYLRCPDDLELPAFADPDDAIGDDLKLHLPTGPDGKRWRVLTNDIQILLHNHPVNQRRAAQGAVAINGLWLWGGGKLPSKVKSRAARYFGDDASARTLARLAGVAIEPLTIQAIESSDGWRDSTEGRPSVIDLRRAAGDTTALMLSGLASASRHRAGELVLNLADGTRVLHRAWYRWRFWRKG